MTRPVVFVLDDDAEVMRALRDDLSRRFARDFRVLGESSAAAALAKLHRLARRGDRVALLIVDHDMTELPGLEVLPTPMSCIRRPSGCSWWSGTTRPAARSSRP
jgi:thioredoxin reductase (NADPH)